MREEGGGRERMGRGRRRGKRRGTVAMREEAGLGWERLSLEDEHGPAVVCCLFCLVEPELLSCLCEERYVFFVETAEDEAAAGGKGLYDLGHVVDEDVAVDVCDDDVKDAIDVTEYADITEQNVDEFDVVDVCVVSCVFHAPFVYVVGSDVCRPASFCYDG